MGPAIMFHDQNRRCHWRVFFGGASCYQFTSSMQRQRLPISPAHIHRHSWLGSKRGHWHMNGARPPTPRDITARGTGAWQRLCVWDTSPNAFLAHPGRHTQRVMLRLSNLAGPQGWDICAILHRGRRTLKQHALLKTRQSPKLWRVLHARSGARPPVCNQSFATT